MAFINYRIDEKAHNLVQNFYQKGVNNQVFKMRTTVAFGLERFWGEQWRFSPDKDKEKDKHEYWKAVWKQLVDTMTEVGITSLPNEEVRTIKGQLDTDQIRAIADQIWAMDQNERKIVQAILLQLCDSLIWWTQRYKKLAPNGDNDDE